MIRNNRYQHYARNNFIGVDPSKFASNIPLENIEYDLDYYCRNEDSDDQQEGYIGFYEEEE